MTFRPGFFRPAAIRAVANTDMPSMTGPTSAELIAAGARFDERVNRADRTGRSDDFALGKAVICRDLAKRLERFGDFASDKQREFAKKLVEWSQPRERAAAPAPAKLEVHKLFLVMQKHAHFYAERLKLSRRNQDSLVWILWDDVCVGKIEDATVTLFARKLGADVANVEGLLREFDADPLAAAVKYGKLSGRCCSCGRDLTNDDSIEAGIGPICAQKFAL